MNDRPGRAPHSGRPTEDGAACLFARVRAACAGCEDLPARLEAGLRAALEMLAADPDLARLLTVEPWLGGEDALHAQQRWIDRFGVLLREAAVADPRAVPGSSFLAPFLISGVRYQIARLVLNGETADLHRLLPENLEALLAYYYEPGESHRLARAVLSGKR